MKTSALCAVHGFSKEIKSGYFSAGTPTIVEDGEILKDRIVGTLVDGLSTAVLDASGLTSKVSCIGY